MVNMLLGEKVTLGPIFKRKKFFLTCYGTSSNHHRRWLKVQRTCLKPFPTSEGHVGQIKLCGRLRPKIVIFWRKFSSGVPGGCTYFSERPAPQTHPMGSYLREKSCPTSPRGYCFFFISNFQGLINAHISKTKCCIFQGYHTWKNKASSAYSTDSILKNG